MCNKEIDTLISGKKRFQVTLKHVNRAPNMENVQAIILIVKYQ